MPNGIFLTNHPSHINAVYTGEIFDEMQKICSISDAIYQESDLLKNHTLFADTEVIFSTWGMPALTEVHIKRVFPQLKLVLYAAGSVQNFARPFLENGIQICSAWAANAVPVAEFTSAQILLANKGFFQANRYARSDYAAAREYCSRFPGNYHTTVGILGAGMIGSLVIEYLAQHQLKIKVFDPFLSEERARIMAVEKTSLEDIFSNCQTISNHLANNTETRGILDGKLFSLMLPQATFINTGRGAQVVETDLIQALLEHPERTALLDVTDPEPPGQDSPFLKISNVILTPHIAGGITRELPRMAEYMVDDYNRWLLGQDLRNEVTLDMLRYMA